MSSAFVAIVSQALKELLYVQTLAYHELVQQN